MRKYKPFFDRFPDVKGEAETLFVFERGTYRRKKVLVVVDLIETGNSLEATVRALAEIGCTTVGAFYLCDVMKPEIRQNFSFPIHSFVQLK